MEHDTRLALFGQIGFAEIASEVSMTEKSIMHASSAHIASVFSEEMDNSIFASPPSPPPLSIIFIE